MHEVPNPMGEPEPIKSEDRNLFVNSIAAAGIAIWGVLAFAVGIVPARARGASHSAKLKWQQRQCEIDQAIAAQSAGENKAGCDEDAPVQAERK